MEKNKIIVISAINIISGGPLTVLKQTQNSLEDQKNIKIIYLLGTKNILSLKKNEKALYFPLAKKSWLIRLFYEYIYFKNLSKKIKADIWFSLHDISPNIVAKKKYVYCHNPSIFLKLKLIHFLDFKLVLFKFFYKYLYRININTNDSVIVQQHWMKTFFRNEISSSVNIQVLRPDENREIITKFDVKKILLNIRKKSKIYVLYPTMPRTFKNIELLVDISKNKLVRSKFNFHVTIRGNENLYSKYIKFYASKLKNIKLIGYQSNIMPLYKKADIIITTSILETWCLPLSEATFYKKIIFAPNLPYAMENLRNYPLAFFYDPYKTDDLINKISSLDESNITYKYNLKTNKSDLDWTTFWSKIIK
jgi:hypothetical protein